LDFSRRRMHSILAAKCSKGAEGYRTSAIGTTEVAKPLD
jgi:hypothetical protein